MVDPQIFEKIISYSLKSWNKTFGGVSAIDIAENVGITNEEAMSFLEYLVSSGRGTINSNVELYVITRDTENPKFEMPSKTVKTHIYFPDTSEIENHFYSSGLAREESPDFEPFIRKTYFHCFGFG